MPILQVGLPVDSIVKPAQVMLTLPNTDSGHGNTYLITKDFFFFFKNTQSCVQTQELESRIQLNFCSYQSPWPGTSE